MRLIPRDPEAFSAFVAALVKAAGRVRRARRAAPTPAEPSGLSRPKRTAGKRRGRK